MKRKQYQIERKRRSTLKDHEKSLLAYGERGGSLRIHFVYPNSYSIALSSLGYHVVYRIFAQFPGVVVERAFFEQGESNFAVSSAHRTFETARSVADCDILAFCCQFELDYINILTVLRDTGLLTDSSARSSKRYDNPFCSPLILLGGNAVTINPEPFADYADIMLLGEAEEALPVIMQTVIDSMKTGLSEDQLLRLLAEVGGVYVPRFYSVNYKPDYTIAGFEKQVTVNSFPKRRYVADLEKVEPAHSVFISPDTVFDSVFLVETGRGCEMNCRFCASAYFARPVRKRSARQIRESLAVGASHCDAFGLIGTAVSSHPQIVELAQEICAQGGRVALSSLMVKKVSCGLAEALARSDSRSVALAPETGSDTLRRAIGKRFTNNDLVEAVLLLAAAGIRRIKLYFMIGLPGETSDDIASIIDLVQKIKSALAEHRVPDLSAVELLISLNSFVPKAWTPFQYEPFCGVEEAKSKLAVIMKGLRSVAGVKVSLEQPKESYVQALISRGDRRVGGILARMVEEGKSFSWLLKNRTISLLPDVPPLDFYAMRIIDFSEILPWEIVDFGVSREILQREAKLARNILRAELVTE